MKLTVDQRDDFSNLLVASRLTDRRRPLCLRLGLNPSSLEYINNRIALDFALELIADCEEKELDDALIRLLKMIASELRDSKRHHAKILNLQEALGCDDLLPQKTHKNPLTSISMKSQLNTNSNEVYYPESHIWAILQIWSPLVIVWMFLLMLAPNYYEKYINQFHASTARNIHISLCSFLTYFPLFILSLGADLNSISISENGTNWGRILWLAVVIAWLITVLIGRVDSNVIGDLIGLIIGILVSIVIGAMNPALFDLSLEVVGLLCISFTGGIAYATAYATINDRNVQGAGIGAAISAVLAGLILIFTGEIVGGILAILTVIFAMAVSFGVVFGLLENLGQQRASRRSVFTFAVFIIILIVLVNGYVVG